MPFPFQSSIDYPASSIRHTKRDPCSFSYWLKWISCNHAKKCNVKNIVIYLRFSSPLSCESFSVRIQVYCFDSIGSFKMYHNIYFHLFKKEAKDMFCGLITSHHNYSVISAVSILYDRYYDYYGYGLL